MTKINSIDNYEKWYSDEIENKEEDDVLVDLFGQIRDLIISVKALLDRGIVWQCFLLNRTLGEIVVFIFVVCSLNKKAREGYYSIYKLHGWLEMEDIFKKSGYKEHKKSKDYKIFEALVKQWRNDIIKEFGESSEELNEKKVNKFVRDKLSKHIYTDAKILIDKKYANIPHIKQVAADILKDSSEYQLESSSVHGKFLSSMLRGDSMKALAKYHILSRVNLAIAVYTIMKED